jgi:hypothetical protein
MSSLLYVYVPEIKKPLFMGISIITIIGLLLTINVRTFLSSTNALTSPCDNGELIMRDKFDLI